MHRPNLDEMKNYLMGLGATEVVTEEFCGSHEMSALVAVINFSVYISVFRIKHRLIKY